MTLIDLPGITRVPVSGSDQSEDIETLTREMAIRYAGDTRTLILAVVSANTDISTSDALQLARRVDHKGTRTIGVITKVITSQILYTRMFFAFHHMLHVSTCIFMFIACIPMFMKNRAWVKLLLSVIVAAVYLCRLI